MKLRPRDWLLIFLGLPEGPFRTDQLRITKGMFLFSKKRKAGSVGSYKFEPYDYGPFSRDLYRDLDALESEGAVRHVEQSGTNRKIFELTAKGRRQFELVVQSLPEGDSQLLTEIKERVTSLNFADLLSSVYQEYPQYAARSKARTTLR